MNAPLQVTDVKIRIVEGGSDGLLAWASIVVGQAIRLDNIAVRRGRDGGLFLTFPAKKSIRGDRYYYHAPISAEAAAVVEDAVLTRLAVLARAAEAGAAGAE